MESDAFCWEGFCEMARSEVGVDFFLNFFSEVVSLLRSASFEFGDSGLHSSYVSGKRIDSGMCR